MRLKKLGMLLAGAAFAALCTGTAAAAPTQDRDRDQTQDRIQDADKLQDQDRLRDKEQLQTPDQDRDRDRDRIAQDQLTSLSLLTSSERNQMIERLRSAKTVEERNRVRDEYQKTIRTRAQELGLNAPFGSGAGQGVGNGAMLMGLLTDQERTRFYQQMRDAKTTEARNRIRDEHQSTIRERAQQMGIDLPPNFGFGPGPGPGAGAQQQMQQQQMQQQEMQQQQRMQQQQTSPMRSPGGGMGSGAGGGGGRR